MLLIQLEEEWTPIELKTWASKTISGCLESRVGGNKVRFSTFTPIRDIVFCQEKKAVIHWDFFPVGWKNEPWVVASDVMSPLGYVRQNILNKDRFCLWEFPADLWMHMNE